MKIKTLQNRIKELEKDVERLKKELLVAVVRLVVEVIFFVILLVSLSGCSVDVAQPEVEINQESIIFAVRQHVALVGICQAMQSGQNQEEAMLWIYFAVLVD